MCVCVCGCGETRNIVFDMFSLRYLSIRHLSEGIESELIIYVLSSEERLELERKKLVFHQHLGKIKTMSLIKIIYIGRE